MKRSLEETEAVDVPMEDETVEVDFDFFNISNNDYLSLKNLLRQLFDVDSIKVNIADLTDLIIEKSVGSTIKTEGEESDPFAIFALLGADSPILKELTKYYIERTGDVPELNRALRKLDAGKSKVAYLFSERFINMPHEIVVPLYQILLDELKEVGTTYDYVIIPSRAYTEHESTLDGEKHRKKVPAPAPEVYHFHLEDDHMSKFALACGSFEFETPFENTDSRRAFQEMGIKPRGYLSVVKFKDLEKVLDMDLNAMSE